MDRDLEFEARPFVDDAHLREQQVVILWTLVSTQWQRLLEALVRHVDVIPQLSGRR